MRLLDPKPPADRPVLAMFDMDRTLLTENSAALWLRFERREGRMSRLDLLRGIYWLTKYQLGVADMATLARRVVALSAGYEARVLEARIERWHQEMVRPTISQTAVERLEAHRLVGHQVAILTASTQFGASQVAQDLDIEHLVCTRLEIDGEGRLTGRIVGDVCYGEGKLSMALRFATERQSALADAWFYSDSYTDLPLLQAVGNPVAVNPDPRLSRHARRAGWPVVFFD